MSNRDALRRLTRKYPTSPETQEILTTLYDAPDMTAAILGAALLEAELERLLVDRFVVKRADLMGQIFLNRGPLMDFHSKIIVANAMGAITSPLAEEMHSIKSIRNAFAHAKEPITFEHELIRREIESGRIFAAIKETALEGEPGYPDSPLAKAGNKGKYLMAVQMALVFLTAIKSHPGTADQAVKAIVAWTESELKKSE